MPAHIKFINVLLVPLNAAKLSGEALRNRVTGGPGNKELVSPADVYRGFQSLARQRETICVSYKHYRECMDASDPNKQVQQPRYGLPKEDWALYFQSGTMFDIAVQRYYKEFGAQQGHDLTLIVYPRNNALKRIEVTAPDISSPSIIWINGKGAFPNASG